MGFQINLKALYHFANSSRRLKASSAFFEAFITSWPSRLNKRYIIGISNNFSFMWSFDLKCKPSSHPLLIVTLINVHGLLMAAHFSQAFHNLLLHLFLKVFLFPPFNFCSKKSFKPPLYNLSTTIKNFLINVIFGYFTGLVLDCQLTYLLRRQIHLSLLFCCNMRCCCGIFGLASSLFSWRSRIQYSAFEAEVFF
ncbi:MAG: hypothetical protein CM15mP51_05600 [Porticoccaceae bacterium]|nr:MAG: hypothetical protein CM15mP51_05600 [Porticoccaceae bacterium]